MLPENAIVVAVDGTDRVHDAVRWAARTARAAGVPLAVVSSFEMSAFQVEASLATDGDFESMLQTEVHKTVEIAVAEARETAPDIEVSGHVLNGHPAKVLIDLSDHVEVLVIGSRGRGTLASSLLGSVSVKVASHSSGSVVVCGPRASGAPETGPVVVGVDGSEASDPALEAALRYARIAGESVIAVLAWADDSAVPTAGWSLSSAHRSRMEEAARTVLAGQLDRHRSAYPEVRIDSVIGHGPAGLALIGVAEEHRASLAVVGSRGHGGFSGMLLGSTSHTVLHLSPVPVLVARPHRSKR
jgi:nucleotide-binding universal stress UspA family protein